MRIEPSTLYTARQLGEFLGLAEQTVYMAASGQKPNLPLPRATRLGRTLRFAGAHILEFYAELGVVLTARSEPMQAPAPTEGQPRRAGRPRKTAAPVQGAAA